MLNVPKPTGRNTVSGVSFTLHSKMQFIDDTSSLMYVIFTCIFHFYTESDIVDFRVLQHLFIEFKRIYPVIVLTSVGRIVYVGPC